MKALKWYKHLLGSIRRKCRRWERRDRRQKSGWAGTKWAVRRDGDYFLVECPQCHSQKVWFYKDKGLFECIKSYECKTVFSVYTEDGVVRLADHRRGDVRFPARAVYDPGCGLYRLGIEQSVPWWWSEKIRIERDLHGGLDAHRHQPYKIVDVLSRQGEAHEEALAVSELRA